MNRFAFNFFFVTTLIRYTGMVNNFRLLGCVPFKGDFVPYNGDFVIPWSVISGICSLHFTVTLAWLKDIVPLCIGGLSFVRKGLVISRCNCRLISNIDLQCMNSYK